MAPVDSGQPGARNRAELRTRLIWLALAVAIGVKALASPTRHTVWPVFALASQHFWASLPLYVDYPNVDMYRYSPTFAVALSPLGLLPLGIGGCLWGMGSILLLYWSLQSFHAVVLGGRPGRSAFLDFSALGIAQTAWNLQSNVLLLALMVFGTTEVVRGRWWRAAFLLAAPIYIKLWPLAGVTLIAAWPRPLVPRLIVALIAFAALPFLAASPETVLYDYREWETVLRLGQGLRWPGYRDLQTVCEEMGVAVKPRAYQVAQLLGGGLALAACLAAYRRAKPGQTGLEFALAIWLSWQLLLGPGSERNTYGLIAPFMAWEFVRGYLARRRWLVPGLCYAVIVLYSSGDAEKVTLKAFSGAEAILPIAVCVFAAWLVWHRFRPARGGT
jgi:hypothetical protein